MFIIARSIASREADVCMINAPDIMMCASMPGCVDAGLLSRHTMKHH